MPRCRRAAERLMMRAADDAMPSESVDYFADADTLFAAMIIAAAADEAEADDDTPSDAADDDAPAPCR